MEDIVQKIIISLEEQLKNTGKVASELKKIVDAGHKTDKSVKEIDKNINKLSKDFDKFRGSLYKFTSGLSRVTSSFNLLKNLASGISARLIALVSVTTKNNESFVKLAIVSNKANVSLSKLRETYNNLAKDSKTMTSSMQDAADAVAAFAEQSFSSRTFADSLSNQIVKIQEILAKNLGDKKQAKELLRGFLTALPPAEIKRLMSQYQFGSESMLDAIFAVSPDAAIKAKDLFNIYNQLPEVIDKNTRATISWNKIVSEFNTLLDRFSQQFLDTFGDQISSSIKEISDNWLPRIMDGFKTLLSIVEKLKPVMDEWTSSFNEKLKQLWDSIKIGDTSISTLVSTIKILAAAIIAIPILQFGFGLSQMLVSLGGLSTVIPIISAGLGTISSIMGAMLSPVAALTASVLALAAAFDQFRRYSKSFSGEGTIGGNLYDKFFGNKTFIEGGVSAQSGITPQQRAAMERAQAAARAAEAAEEAVRKINTATTAAGSPTPVTAATTSDFKSDFEIAQDYFKTVKDGLGGIRSAAESAGRALKTAGLSAVFGDQSASQFSQGLSGTIRNAMPQLREQAKKQLQSAQEGLQKALAGGEQKEIVQAYKNIEEAADNVAMVEELINTRIQAVNQQLEIRGELQSKITDLARSDLEISRNLYGTPALAVQALQSVVSSMQKEKELLESQLENVQAMLAEQPDNIALIQKERDLRIEIKKTTAEQLSLVKELRDGYLDAVQAQAFGAGKFEKILITQEQNLGAALDKGIAKRNYLLGQVGDQARAFNRAPLRFSPGGVGILQDLNGQNLSPEQLSKYSRDAISNIGDPANRAAAQQGMSSILGIYGSAQAKASNDNTDALKQNTDALNALISGRSGSLGMGALKGSPAGDTMTGELARLAMVSVPKNSINDIIRDGMQKAREGIRRHWENHAQMWRNNVGISSSIDTSGRKTSSGYGPETAGGYTLNHGKNSGGGNYTRTLSTVANSLVGAANLLVKIVGPALDAMSTEDTVVSRGPSGLRGELGQSGAP